MLVLKQKSKAGVLNSFRSVFDSCFFAVLQLVLVVTVNTLIVTSLRSCIGDAGLLAVEAITAAISWSSQVWTII